MDEGKAWMWSDRAEQLLQAFPRCNRDEDDVPFLPAEDLPARFVTVGLPVLEPVVTFQRELAGHVFYTGLLERHHRWGIQSSLPDNAPGEPYSDECVSLAYAVPFGYFIREDGCIEVDGQIHARSAQVLVEDQALRFEWDTKIRPHATTYFLRLPIRPRADARFWAVVGEVAEYVGLAKVEAASDEVREWFVGANSRICLEPYYGIREFSDETLAKWGLLWSTSDAEVRALHDALAELAGWGTLRWQPLDQDRPNCPADYWWPAPS